MNKTPAAAKATRVMPNPIEADFPGNKEEIKAVNVPSGPCYIVDASSGCSCVARQSSCPGNVGCSYVGWNCGDHMQPNRVGCCSCDIRTPSSNEYITGACQCVSRTQTIGCSYNVVKMDINGKNNLPKNQKA